MSKTEYDYHDTLIMHHDLMSQYFDEIDKETVIWSKVIIILNLEDYLDMRTLSKVSQLGLDYDPIYVSYIFKMLLEIKLFIIQRTSIEETVEDYANLSDNFLQFLTDETGYDAYNPDKEIEDKQSYEMYVKLCSYANEVNVENLMDELRNIVPEDTRAIFGGWVVDENQIFFVNDYSVKFIAHKDFN